MPPDPGAAAQSRAALEDQGHRPHRPDPRDLRRAARTPARACSRSSSPRSPTSARGWCARGPTSSGSAAASASWAARARASSSSTGAGSPSGSSASSRSWPTCAARAACTARPARVPYPVVALVGYTNAGKSTLFNRLTGAAVDARDQVFATLDPTMRQLRAAVRRERRSSPTRWASSPTCRPRWWPRSAPRSRRCSRPTSSCMCATSAIPTREAQRRDVEARPGRARHRRGRPRRARLVEVWNKIDRLAAEELAALRAEAGASRRRRAWSRPRPAARGPASCSSWSTARLAASRDVVELDLDYGEGELLAWLHRAGRGAGAGRRGDGLHLKVAVAPAERARLAHRFGRPV